MQRYFVYLLGLLIVLGIAGTSTAAEHPESTHIKDQYIVVFKDSVTNPGFVAHELSLKHKASVEHEYTTITKGFSAHIKESDANKLSNDPRVAYVAPDREVHATSHKTSRIPTNSQTFPSGVNRIGTTSNTGAGVTVAVIDTGIDLTHPDLSANIIANKNCLRPTRNGADDNGHGTHVAGTIAALNNNVGVVGVASQAKLAAVKVLDASGSGSWSSVICGIDWVTANAGKYNIKVANMSLGGGGTSDNNCGNSNNDPLHQALCRSVAAGLTYVVAAGNDGGNAQNFVPAAYDDAVISVSALADSNGLAGGTGAATGYGPDDTFATFSNYGSVVDIAAPGVNINSTWKGGGYKVISGTSMATPHVAGAAALYIKNNPSASWTQVRAGLQSVGETLNNGHTDPSGNHPENVVKINSL